MTSTTQTDRDRFYDYALAQGWAIFPYNDQGRPSFGWQQTDANNTVKYANGLRKTEKVLGVNLGLPSGAVVVDIDVQNGGTRGDLEATFGPMPDTFTVKSPSGGEHLYFQSPGYALGAIKAEAVLQGVDFLGDGRNTAAPTSVRPAKENKPGGEYVVTSWTDPVPLPELILQAWTAAADRHRDAISLDVVQELPEEVHDKVLGWHLENVQKAAEAEQGTRDNEVLKQMAASMKLAMWLPDGALTAEKVASDFEEFCEYRINDLAGKTERAVQYAIESPRDLTHLMPAEPPPGFEVPESIPRTQREDFIRMAKDELLRTEVRKFVVARTAENTAKEVTLSNIASAEAFMATKPEAPPYIIDGILHHDGTALVTAQFKAGKTTLMLNMVRALTSGKPFLGQFAVPAPKRTVYADLELGDLKLYEWLSKIEGIEFGNLSLMNLRGRGRELDVRTETMRTRQAARLKDLGAQVLIIDPLAPITSASGLSENDSADMRPLLDSLTALAEEADLEAVVAVQHAGHSEKGRARGSSAFMDWAASLVNLQKDEDDVRSISAMGRDVALAKSELVYDEATHTYTVESVGRGDPVAQYLADMRGGPLTVEQVTSKTGLTKNAAKARLENHGWVVVEEATRGQNAKPAVWEYRSTGASVLEDLFAS